MFITQKRIIAGMPPNKSCNLFKTFKILHLCGLYILEVLKHTYKNTHQFKLMTIILKLKVSLICPQHVYLDLNSYSFLSSIPSQGIIFIFIKLVCHVYIFYLILHLLVLRCLLCYIHFIYNVYVLTSPMTFLSS